ncbi:MAG TPA: AAA-like domain-containing protein [Oculatellaceae cyanobacterium]
MEPSKLPSNRYIPNLGEFGVAILEHYVTSLIGASAVGKLREPYERNKLFFSLAQALEKTEDEFLKNSQNPDVRDLLLQLPLRKDQDLLQALKGFSANPGSPLLPRLMIAKIRKYAPQIKEESVTKAVSEYMFILRREFVSVPEIRDALSTWATIETAQSTKKIEENSAELVGLLKQVVDNTKIIASSPADSPRYGLKEKGEFISGTLPNPSHQDYYVIREQDKDLKRALKGSGESVTIKGSRKTGKTLLILNTLPKLGKKHIYVDLKEIDGHFLDQTDAFYIGFCELIASELNIRSGLQLSWKKGVSGTQQVTSFIEDHILKEQKESLVIAIDHADKLIGTNLAADFFPMLRHWHNSRFKRIGWENVDLVIAISTDSKLLISDSQESPYNFGTIIHLEDFSYDEVVKLNSLYKNWLSAEDLHQLYKLINGHPYLTRLALDAACHASTELTQTLVSPLDRHSPFEGY